MIYKIEVAPKLLKCTNYGATFLYRRLVREQGFDLPYSEIKCGDGCRRVNNNQNNIIMSNERTGVDTVLDWIVPIRLSGKWMNVEVERGVKIMLSLILLATILTHAISKTLEVVPPDAADSVVWTKFSLYLLCDIIVYIGIIAGVLLLKPLVLELIEIIEELINKKTETSDKDSLIQEVVPMVKVDPIEIPLPYP